MDPAGVFRSQQPRGDYRAGRPRAGGSLERVGNRGFAAVEQNGFGARANLASAGWPRGGGADFTGRHHARQSFASTSELFAAGARRYRGFSEPALFGMDARSDSGRLVGEA